MNEELLLLEPAELLIELELNDSLVLGFDEMLNELDEALLLPEALPLELLGLDDEFPLD